LIKVREENVVMNVRFELILGTLTDFVDGKKY
jgi:hypothetical protein